MTLPYTALTVLKKSIYDDNAFLRHALASLIAAQDDIMLAGVYDHCLCVQEEILADDPDIVLMDISLPGLSGLSGMQAIKKVRVHTDVIIITVFADDEILFDALCKGASGYLLKDHSMDVIL